MGETLFFVLGGGGGRRYLDIKAVLDFVKDLLPLYIIELQRGIQWHSVLHMAFEDHTGRYQKSGICCLSSSLTTVYSASLSCCFTLGERAPSTHWIGGLVCPRAGLDDVEKWKFLTLPRLNYPSIAVNTWSCQSLCQSLLTPVFCIGWLYSLVSV
jgi:hypothetical protein